MTGQGSESDVPRSVQQLSPPQRPLHQQHTPDCTRTMRASAHDLTFTRPKSAALHASTASHKVGGGRHGWEGEGALVSVTVLRPHPQARHLAPPHRGDGLVQAQLPEGGFCGVWWQGRVGTLGHRPGRRRQGGSKSAGSHVSSVVLALHATLSSQLHHVLGQVH